jgi:hypothetical protein
MSGICTNQRFAILDTSSGMDLDTYTTKQELCKAAMWRIWQDFIVEQVTANGPNFEHVYARHVAWLRAEVDRIEAMHIETVRGDIERASYDE